MHQRLVKPQHKKSSSNTLFLGWDYSYTEVTQKLQVNYRNELTMQEVSMPNTENTTCRDRSNKFIDIGERRQKGITKGATESAA
ncbi:hypothetical protein BPOR_0415g00090 [Botrytis porri]|uniref:Uncharacterized protein n=1 Tax=Botrytis porri TaxID=87229 RepID=A0A4Z1KLV2_9HELO|nr:hypothetical protein BPOR_0415g00090 [Botrytis porri]